MEFPHFVALERAFSRPLVVGAAKGFRIRPVIVFIGDRNDAARLVVPPAAAFV